MKKAVFSSIFIFLIAGLFFIRMPARAQSIAELQQRINENNDTIKQLEAEIAQYQTELSKTASEAKTLQSTVQALDLNSKKLGTDIRVTENKIGSTNLSIQKLSQEITDKQTRINRNHEVLKETLQEINESDGQSLLETLLLYPDASTFWRQIEATNQFQTSVRNNIDVLRGLTQSLVADKNETEAQKTQLEQLKSQLADQQKIIEINKQEKNRLLAETRNREAGYKQILADKVAKKKAFEKELLQYESQLKIAIDPKSIPTAKSGILSWPVDKPILTQHFGHTEFSKTTAAYNGNGHNGIDLGMPIGTPIKAALSGVVEGTGDTDTTCPGASYGRWVLIKHGNGLTTLYAHLSVIKVSPGTSVGTGEVIGYSGFTGYATGPHLHFTVYASQGVQIMSRPSKSCGGATYTMPVADLKAYLNPMLYL